MTKLKTLSEVLGELERMFPLITPEEIPHEEFRENFNDIRKSEFQRLKTFLSTRIKQLLERVVPEEKKLPRRFDCADCVSLINELDRDDAVCAMCNGERGFNSCRDEVKNKIKEILL